MKYLTDEAIEQKILEEMKFSLSLNGQPDLNASLKDDLCLDSLDFIELIMVIESCLDVEIDDSILEDLETVGDLVSKCTELYRSQNENRR